MIVSLMFLGFIVVPVVMVILNQLQLNLSYGTFANNRIEVGDSIVYLKQKASTHPGVRAHDIYPSGHGDDYYYLVDKYWTVAEVLNDGMIVAKTRTNKNHYLRTDDPNLRRAKLIERLKFGRKFPKLSELKS